MERCRWIPNETGENYILVNIPAYKMYIYEEDTLNFTINVVVGKSTTSTTIFNDELEYVVFSPYWVPPPSILNNEILPSLKRIKIIWRRKTWKPSTEMAKPLM